MLDLSALRNAISSLRGALDVAGDAAWFGQQSANVQNTLIAGVIRNFEFVYELSVKMICRHIELTSDSPAEVDQIGFRDLIRVAAEKGLIADVEARFTYRKMRNVTAHTCAHAKAQMIYRDIPAFVAGAQALLASLEARNV